MVAALLFWCLTAATVEAAPCGDTAAGFDRWKAEFAREAAAGGIGVRGLSALAATKYSTRTIAADRGQRSFRLSLDQFMQTRGGRAIAQRGKRVKTENAALFDRIEEGYGVPAGPLIAIWGMESAFGGFMGDSHILSAVATLTFDCRRSDFFVIDLHAALRLVDNGTLSPDAVGAAHGEIGQTQFLPRNVLQYGVDGDGNGRVDLIGSAADAFASTANFLRAHGWQPGAGYRPGEPNFAALEGWNAASVYQQAIALIAAEIDER